MANANCLTTEDQVPKFTVSIEMDFEADDEEHAAALGYKALLNNPPPLYYKVTKYGGQCKDIVVTREAVEEFPDTDDFVKVADSLLSIFTPKR